MENQLIIKICRTCKISTNEHDKFRGLRCIKCCSKQNNEKLKEKDYYKEYWLEHKIPGLKRGRPFKQKVN